MVGAGKGVGRVEGNRDHVVDDGDLSVVRRRVVEVDRPPTAYGRPLGVRQIQWSLIGFRRGFKGKNTAEESGHMDLYQIWSTFRPQMVFPEPSGARERSFVTGPGCRP